MNIYKWLLEWLTQPVSHGLFIVLLISVMVWLLVCLLSDCRRLSTELDTANVNLGEYVLGNIDFDTLSERFGKIGVLASGWQSLSALAYDERDAEGRNAVFLPQRIDSFFAEHRILGGSINVMRYQNVPALIIAMGVFFTVIGLVLALQIAGSGMASGNVNDLQLAVQKLTDAAVLKFSVILLAVFCAFLFAWIRSNAVSNLRTQLSELIAAIECAFETTSLERLTYQRNQELAMHSQLLIAQLEEAKSQTTALQRAELVMPQVLSSEIVKTMSQQNQLLRDHLGQLISQHMNANPSAMQDLFLQSMTEMRETLALLLQAEVDKVSGVLVNLTTAISEVHHDIQSINVQDGLASSAQALVAATEHLKSESLAIAASLRQVTESAERSANILGRSTDELVILHGYIDSTLSGLKEAGDSFNLTASRIDSVHSAQSTALKQVQELFAGATAAVRDISQAGVQVESISDALKHAWESYQQRFETVDQSVQSVFISLQEGVDQYSRKVRDFHGTLDMQLGIGIQGLGMMMQELSEKVDDLTVARH